MPHDIIPPDAETLTQPKVEENHLEEFENIAIIGVGMVGGSVGLALRESGFRGQIIGLDKSHILDKALTLGAIDRAVGDLAQAVPHADLVVVATPVLETQKLLPTILRIARPGTVVTDTGGTKSVICDLAARTEGARGVFIGGHPLTGTVRQGIANAHADFFTSAYYVLTPLEEAESDQLESLKWWVRHLGAIPLVLDPDVHDRLVAVIHHLPLFFSLALAEGAGNLAQSFPVLYRLAQGDFREMTRGLDSPFETWEGLLQTNKEEILKAIERFRKALDNCEAQLKENNLTESFRQAHSFRARVVRTHSGLWDARCELVITAPNRLGTLARITGLLAEHEIGIRDFRLVHVRETHGGTLRLVVTSPSEAALARDLLKKEGFDVKLLE